jgi:hypothetical protein
MASTYVPILKAKEGEFAALEVLAHQVKDAVHPVLEIPGVPIDHASGLPAKTLSQHVANLPDRIVKAWQSRPFYLDTPYFGDKERLDHGPCALEGILAECFAKSAQPIPVLRSGSTDECFSVVAGVSGTVSIRLSLVDFSEDNDVAATVGKMVDAIGRSEASDVDLIIDLGELPRDQSTAILIARSIFGLLPRRNEWRRIILTAASFPEDLSEIGARSIERIPRKEWLLWRALQKRPSLLPRNLLYSDYTISHPTLKEIDPRVMRMSAAIRYTSETEWVIVKGSSVGRYGFEQYFDLCKRLVELEDFAGEDFSWGDRFIADCARSMAGPGNATTWRKVGVNHHMTLVAYQLSNPAEL